MVMAASHSFAAEEEFPAPGKMLYLLEKPVEIEATLGKWSVSTHVGFQIIKSLIVGWTAHSMGAPLLGAVGAGAWQIVRAPPYLRVNTWVQLYLNYKLNAYKKMKEFDKVPGVSRVAIVSSEVSTLSHGIFFTSQKRMGYVVIETSKRLEEFPELQAKFGKAFFIPDSRKLELRLKLQVNGKTLPDPLVETLSDVLNRKSLVNETSQRWREEVENFEKQYSMFQKKVLNSTDAEINILGEVISPDGTSTEIGAIMTGSAVRSFLGMDVGQQIIEYFGIKRQGIVPKISRTMPEQCSNDLSLFQR